MRWEPSPGQLRQWMLDVGLHSPSLGSVRVEKNTIISLRFLDLRCLLPRALHAVVVSRSVSIGIPAAFNGRTSAWFRTTSSAYEWALRAFHVGGCFDGGGVRCACAEYGHGHVDGWNSHAIGCTGYCSSAACPVHPLAHHFHTTGRRPSGGKPRRCAFHRSAYPARRQRRHRQGHSPVLGSGGSGHGWSCSVGRAGCRRRSCQGPRYCGRTGQRPQ